MTLFPRDDENISIKDCGIWFGVLCVICIIMYIHSCIRNMLKKKTAKREPAVDKNAENNPVV